MSRHSILPAFAVALLALPLAGSSSGSRERTNESLPTAAAAQAPVPMAGGFKVRNAAAIPLTVEIRVGLHDDCDTATPIATRTLAPGGFLEIRSSQPLCLRREIAVGGVPQRQGWEKKVPVRGQVEEVAL